MFIRGVIEFLKDVGKEEVCTKVISKIREFWPNDQKVNRKRKFRAAFEYFKSRSNQTNTKSSLEAQFQFRDDSKVKHQEFKIKKQQPELEKCLENT